MITIGNIQRKFIADIEGQDIELADPNPHLSPEEVASFYSNTYPHLTNANVIGPIQDGDCLKFEFKNVIGTKG
jgi:PRTRC genetic system protein C